MISNFENICVLRTYLILLRPIFDTRYKGGNEVKKCMWALYHELVLFLEKVGIVFTVYQRIRPKEESWSGPRHLWKCWTGDLVSLYIEESLYLETLQYCWCRIELKYVSYRFFLWSVCSLPLELPDWLRW